MRLEEAAQQNWSYGCESKKELTKGPGTSPWSSNLEGKYK